MKTDLIDLTRQCCDADGYLSLGYRCAKTNFCYDELRPIGDALWFSLPYRLGLGEDCIFFIQGLLLLLVACTAFVLLRKVFVFWVLAMAVLLLQIWPTFFNSLADTPASLLLIEGLLLALIAAQRQHAGLFFTAGIFLGCSALLRAAYFHPLCAAGLVFFLFWLWQTVISKQSSLRYSIFILSFTIPMTLQFYASWKNMHEWSFLSQDQTHVQFDAHLNSTVVGYDTLLIESSYYWAPPCAPSKGVWTGIREYNTSGLLCLLSNRIRFYFGSYALHTFHGSENKNFISNGFAEDIGNISTWSLHNVGLKTRSVRSHAINLKANLLQAHTVTDSGDAYVESSSLIPLTQGTWTYSIWLWAADADASTEVKVQLFSKVLSEQTKNWNELNIGETTLKLSDQPKQFFLEIALPKRSYLTTRINIMDNVFATGAMLESTNTKIGYQKSQQLLFGPIGSSTQTSGHERVFSKSLLVANLAAIFISFAGLLLLYKKHSSAIYIFIGVLLALISTEALLILPEQRFVQASLAMHWILLFLLIHNLVDKKYGGAK